MWTTLIYPWMLTTWLRSDLIGIYILDTLGPIVNLEQVGLYQDDEEKIIEK